MAAEAGGSSSSSSSSSGVRPTVMRSPTHTHTPSDAAAAVAALGMRPSVNMGGADSIQLFNGDDIVLDESQPGSVPNLTPTIVARGTTIGGGSSSLFAMSSGGRAAEQSSNAAIAINLAGGAIGVASPVMTNVRVLPSGGPAVVSPLLTPAIAPATARVVPAPATPNVATIAEVPLPLPHVDVTITETAPPPPPPPAADDTPSSPGPAGRKRSISTHPGAANAIVSPNAGGTRTLAPVTTTRMVAIDSKQPLSPLSPGGGNRQQPLSPGGGRPLIPSTPAAAVALASGKPLPAVPGGGAARQGTSELTARTSGGGADWDVGAMPVRARATIVAKQNDEPYKPKPRHVRLRSGQYITIAPGSCVLQISFPPVADMSSTMVCPMSTTIPAILKRIAAKHTQSIDDHSGFGLFLKAPKSAAAQAAAAAAASAAAAAAAAANNNSTSGGAASASSSPNSAASGAAPPASAAAAASQSIASGSPTGRWLSHRDPAQLARLTLADVNLPDTGRVAVCYARHSFTLRVFTHTERTASRAFDSDATPAQVISWMLQSWGVSTQHLPALTALFSLQLTSPDNAATPHAPILKASAASMKTAATDLGPSGAATLTRQGTSAALLSTAPPAAASSSGASSRALARQPTANGNDGIIYDGSGGGDEVKTAPVPLARTGTLATLENLFATASAHVMDLASDLKEKSMAPVIPLAPGVLSFLYRGGWLDDHVPLMEQVGDATEGVGGGVITVTLRSRYLLQYDMDDVVPPTEPVPLELMYSQAIDALHSGNLDCTMDQAVSVASLHFNLAFGSQNTTPANAPAGGKARPYAVPTQSKPATHIAIDEHRLGQVLPIHLLSAHVDIPGLCHTVQHAVKTLQLTALDRNVAMRTILNVLRNPPAGWSTSLVTALASAQAAHNVAPPATATLFGRAGMAARSGGAGPPGTSGSGAGARSSTGKVHDANSVNWSVPNPLAAGTPVPAVSGGGAAGGAGAAGSGAGMPLTKSAIPGHNRDQSAVHTFMLPTTALLRTGANVAAGNTTFFDQDAAPPEAVATTIISSTPAVTTTPPAATTTTTIATTPAAATATTAAAASPASALPPGQQQLVITTTAATAPVDDPLAALNREGRTRTLTADNTSPNLLAVNGGGTGSGNNSRQVTIQPSLPLSQSILPGASSMAASPAPFVSYLTDSKYASPAGTFTPSGLLAQSTAGAANTTAASPNVIGALAPAAGSDSSTNSGAPITPSLHIDTSRPTMSGMLAAAGNGAGRGTVASPELVKVPPAIVLQNCVMVFELMKRANLVRGLHPCVLRIDFQELTLTLSDPNNERQDKRFRVWSAAMMSRLDKDTEDGTRISMVVDGVKRDLTTFTFVCANALERQSLFEALSYVQRKSYTAPYATYASMPASMVPSSNSPLPVLPLTINDTDASLRVLIVTLNMGKAPLWNSQADWLPVDGENDNGPNHRTGYDIIAFGVQECTMNDADLISILTVRLGAAAAQAFAQNGTGNHSAPAPTSYRLLYSHSMWEIREFVFVATRWFPFIRNVECDTVKTGVGNVIANKGGIGIAFAIFDTPLCFINCHLAAHQNEVKNRNRDAQLIGSQLKLHHSKHGFCCTDTYNQFAALFWFGDLNYRTVDERDIVLKLADSHNWPELLKREQLVKEMREGRAFVGLTEEPIRTPPTYRYHTTSDEWSKVKLYNLPSWTDRVLYRRLSADIPPIGSATAAGSGSSSGGSSSSSSSSSASSVINVNANVAIISNSSSSGADSKSKPKSGDSKSDSKSGGSPASSSSSSSSSSSKAPAHNPWPSGAATVGIGGLLSLTPHKYQTMMDVYGSDHRPIIHTFTIRIRLPAVPTPVQVAINKANAAETNSSSAVHAVAVTPRASAIGAGFDSKSVAASAAVMSAAQQLVAATAAMLETEMALNRLRLAYPTFGPLLGLIDDPSTRASSPSIFDATSGSLLSNAVLPTPSLLQVLIYGWRVSLKAQLAKEITAWDGVRLALFSPYLFTQASSGAAAAAAAADAKSSANGAGGDANGAANGAGAQPNADGAVTVEAAPNAIAAAAAMASRHIALYSMIAAPSLVRGAEQVAHMVDFPAQFAAPEVLCVALLPLSLPVLSQQLLHLALIAKGSKTPIAFAHIPLNELQYAVADGRPRAIQGMLGAGGKPAGRFSCSITCHWR